ncbi:MAG: hypothetical protein AB8G16_19505 [Gammaproteobacteria bacterium]
MNRISLGALVVAAYALAPVAHAQVLQLNDPTLPASADGFNITRDLDTGFEWLDVGVTAGRTYDDLVGNDGSNEFIAGGDFEGFRYATYLELTGAFNGPQLPSLYRSLGISPFSFSSVGGYSVVRDLLAVVGCFGECTTYGYVSGNLIGRNGEAPAGASMEAFPSQGFSFGQSRPTEFSTVLPPNDGLPEQRGNWLVRNAGDVDADNDLVYDMFDNCVNAANPQQIDADGDNFGNACDGDLNNDCIVNVADLGLMRAVFFTTDPVADLNADGMVNVLDLGLLRAAFFQPPGPSGLNTNCP